MGRVIAAFAQFFDGSGDPLSNGWLRFTEPNTNNTFKNTYADDTLQILNENPLQLDGEGRCPNVFGTGSYRIVSYTEDVQDESIPGVQVQQFDPVTAQGTSTGGGSGGSFQEWDMGTTYGLGDIVLYGGYYYRSLLAVNFNLNPAVETGSWERIDFLPVYNSTITYNEGDVVYDGDEIYLSKNLGNQNNTPSLSPNYWRALDTFMHTAQSKTADYTILASEQNNLFILGSGAAAGRTFTLPTVTIANNRFRVGFYNDSSYDLTIAPSGSASVWVDVSGNAVLQRGAHVELMYIQEIDTWVPLNNAGTLLGAQNLGTANTPMLTAYINTLAVQTALTAPSATITTLGATTANLATANVTTLAGVVTADIDTLRIDTIINFGTTPDATIYSSTNLYITSTANLYIDALNTNLSGGLSMDDDKHFYMGTSHDIDMYWNSSISWFYIDLATTGASVYFSNSAGGAASRVLFGTNARFTDDKYLYFGSSDDCNIRYISALSYGMIIQTAADDLTFDIAGILKIDTTSSIQFFPGGTNTWVMEPTGALVGVGTPAFGSTTYPVGDIVSTGVYGRNISAEPGIKRAVYVASNGRMGYI